MVTWFAGLFYLPRLFVYHAMCTDQAGIDRFKVMERKLYYGIMTPGGLLTIIFGTWLWLGYGFSGGVAAYQAGPGRVTGCLPPLLREVADRLQKRPQPAWSRVLPLVQ